MRGSSERPSACFRGHVLGGAEDNSSPRQRTARPDPVQLLSPASHVAWRVGDELGETKVEHLDELAALAAPDQDDVLGLEVTVDDPCSWACEA